MAPQSSTKRLALILSLIVVLSLAVFLTVPGCKNESGPGMGTISAPTSTVVTPLSTGPITVTVPPTVSATGIIGTSGTGTAAITSMTFTFPASMVTQTTNVTIAAVPQSSLPALPYPCDNYFMSFTIAADPASVTTFSKRVEISTQMSSTVPIGTTLYLGTLQNNTWVIVSTLVVGSRSRAVQNLPSTTLPGILSPGTYILYQEPWDCGGPIKPVSNLGVALVADDGSTLQVIHLYDTAGNVLSRPTMVKLNFTGACDIDGTAVTPDGARGIIVDGCTNSARFFNGANIPGQDPIISGATLDISVSGMDGDSVAIMPSGDDAVATGDTAGKPLAYISGMLSGNPIIAGTIPTPGARDGLVISNDGKVLLARGPGGLTAFTISRTTATSTFTQMIDIPALGTSMPTDGREGMAITPVGPCDRAVIVDGSTVSLLTNLGSSATPTVTNSLTIPSSSLLAVSITPDGKYAVLGSSSGIYLVSGVDTGSLALVTATPYMPAYTGATASVTLTQVYTLGITLDGLYAAVCDSTNSSLLVIPITTTGFSAPVGILTGVTCPGNDQLVTH